MFCYFSGKMIVLHHHAWWGSSQSTMEIEPKKFQPL